ncbi:HNH endonuclease [Staphylococcus phage VB-SauS-SA2]|nr:HNH endonuclease [Staphylococcus phage VB-SauS-SA2]
MNENITRLKELYIELIELLKEADIKEESILKVDSILTEVDREMFYREMGWSQDVKESDIECTIDLSTLNINNKENYHNIIPTNIELLLKMKEAGQNFFNDEYKADFKEDNIICAGGIVQEEPWSTKEKVQNKLIRQLERAYASDNIKTIYDTGYISTVTKDNTKYYVLSTYCRK